jgi:hypothetical protein
MDPVEPRMAIRNMMIAGGRRVTSEADVLIRRGEAAGG